MTAITTDDIYQLGAWMGRKQAFASLAGRCSAADAECLRQIRERKRYRALKLNWEQFCKQHVGVSYMTVDKIIRRLEEFGPAYFFLTQATGITDREYREISSAVRDQKLLHAGEEIPIDAENAPKLAAAVEALKQQACLSAEAEAEAKPATANVQAEPAAANAKARPGPMSVRDVVLELQKARMELCSALRRYRGLARQKLTAQSRERVSAALQDYSRELKELSERVAKA